MSCIARSATFLVVAALLGARPVSVAAQSPRAAGMPRDSILGCAVRLATAAGFRPVPGARPDRVGLMRPRDTGGTTYPLDALRLSLSPADSGVSRLEVRVTTFVVSRATGLNQDEVSPAPVLTALVDTLRLRCR